MRFKNHIRILVAAVSLVVGCCFANNVFAARETYVENDGYGAKGAVIEWEIKDAPEKLGIKGAKTLWVYSKKGKLTPWSLFGDFIREKCSKEGIELRGVMTNGHLGLGYYFRPNGDLLLGPAGPNCRDFEAPRWPLKALNLVMDTKTKDITPNIYKTVTKTTFVPDGDGDGYGYYRENVKVLVEEAKYIGVDWGRDDVRDVLIVDFRVYAADGVPSSVPTPEDPEEKKEKEKENWYILFENVAAHPRGGRRVYKFVIGKHTEEQWVFDRK
jgi:hypothetical protein